MNDSRDSGAAIVAIALALLMLVLLVAGGGAFVVWKRQRVVQQEMLMRMAEAEAVRAQAKARQLAEAEEQANWAAANAAVSGGVDPASIEEAIRGVLEAQQTAWNAGDVDQFMEHYWKSEKLTFNADGTMTRGWQDTLESYKQRYPSQADMGQLTFSDLEITSLGSTAALVLGKWQLARDDDVLGGSFTLAFRNLDGRWVIVHDHTTRSRPAEAESSDAP